VSRRSVVEAYLSGLGLDSALPPTLESLVRLHRAHLEQVPYENLGIMLGRPPSVDPRDCLERVARVGRAGYCFHQNGAFELALRALGYDVTRRQGHVWSDESQRHTGSLNHLALVVSGLPTDANPTGQWWADVGLGDAFVDPLPVVEGTYEQDGFRYSIGEVDGGGWSFRHDPSGVFTGVEVTGDEVGLGSVEAAHAELSHPETGHFARFLAVYRRSTRGVDAILGCRLLRIDRSGAHEDELTTYDEWRAALADVTALNLDDVDTDDLRRLWIRTRQDHDEWLASGRP
jgi:N-hydroxyarylamine O-acetyltransferase